MSDGRKFSNGKQTQKYAIKLAKAQRARKKRHVSKINAKMKNTRKDKNDKISTELVKTSSSIFLGNVSSNWLTKTNLAKTVYDAGWFQLKLMFAYKSLRLGVNFKIVNEAFSTQTCSVCENRTGPKGLAGLKVRDWVCYSCGSEHDRDINAAKNILRSGQATPIGSPAVTGKLSTNAEIFNKNDSDLKPH